MVKQPPKTIEIGNRIYSLRLDEDPRVDGNRVYGFMSSVHSELVLDKATPPRKMAETLVHELLHCVYADYAFIGVKTRGEEYYVQVGAVGLTKIFRDNPKLLSWWLYLMYTKEDK